MTMSIPRIRNKCIAAAFALCLGGFLNTAFAAEPEKEPPLTFHIFAHDDIPDSEAQRVHTRLLSWWLADMTDTVLRGWNIQARIHRHVPGVTDIRYGDDRAYDRWKGSATRFAEREKLRINGWNKFMLLTGASPYPGTSGIAQHEGDFALASVNANAAVVAHEFGHTLSAVHDDSKVRGSDAWWCETNMVPSASQIYRDCRAYSPENQERIRTYVTGLALPSP
ncbi:hypothetical protein EC912_104187 [Luteibacter rhizovicinus]|uniref:Reprolysin-like metallo-peptidase family M12B n=1 Tax=Luteibacter rhizovicinus TaxID=242606 RepID=A0A4R3YNT1_9GAMM|nr:hypothetical protein [Luteibacter rhizovicinus]TCV93991.1 hypothetical protein EC912_104187 [Luteibacter rhizovicinus]